MNEEIKKAMDVLKREIKKDDDYAWGWQSNIAMASYDRGLSHGAANRAAADFMKNCFNVDMRKNKYFPK